MASFVVRRLLQHSFLNSFYCIRKCSKCLIAIPVRYHLLLTSTFLAKCDSRPKLDLQEPDPKTLSQEYLLKSASAHTADAVTVLLSQAARALIEAEEKYRKALTILTDLTEHHVTVLGNEEAEKLVWDIIIETRSHLEMLNRKRKDLEMLFSCVQKLADASAEVSFLAGTEFSSTSIGERLHNAQRHVDCARAETEKAEELLREMQAYSVKMTTENAEKCKSELLLDDVGTDGDREFEADNNK